VIRRALAAAAVVVAFVVGFVVGLQFTTDEG
jgi:hypothetical protein